MRITVCLLVLVALLGLSSSAEAADITYYILNGAFDPPAAGGSFSGVILINSSTEVIDGGSFTVIAPAGGTAYTFYSTTPGTGADSQVFTDLGGDAFYLNLNGPIGSLGVNTYSAYGTADDTYFEASGIRYDASAGDVSLTATAATPEPSSLALLGTGALGLIGVIRRRIAA